MPINSLITDRELDQDFSTDYLNSRNSLEGDAALSSILQEVQTGFPAGGERGEDAAMPDRAEEKEDGRSAIADIGRGIVETPLQVVGGAADAVKETFEFANDIGEWLNENVADLGQITAEGWKPGAPEESLVGGAIPTTKEAESTTGGIVRGVSKFVAGLIGAGKFLKSAQVLQGATKGAQLGRAAVSGALADMAVFDPHEARLSNLVEEFPVLQNPITEYLAASPDDSGAEGRFKNAVEGLGLGVAAEGLAKGVRMLRSARQTKKALGTAAKQLSPEEIKAIEKETLFEHLGGDPSGESVTFTKMGKGKPSEVEVNFARISAPDDVKDIIGKMVKAGKKDIQAARRGKVSFKEMEISAEKLDAWDVLTSRRKGQPLGAEESLALRKLWVKSADRLAFTADMAAKNPSEGNIFAFRRQLEIHHMIQQETIAARTETARALAQWRIPAEGLGDVERFRSVQQALDNAGGVDVGQKLAERVAAAARSNDPGLLESMTAGVFAKTRETVAQVWINGLLSSPKTHMVNFLSNTTVLGQQMYERKVASLLRGFYGGEGVVSGESMAQATGIVQGVKEALKITKTGRKAIREASRFAMRGDIGAARQEIAGAAEEFGGVFRSLATGETGFGIGKAELGRTGALSAESMGVAQNSMLGRSLDFVDALSQAPGRMLGASDEFFKSIGYRMELNASSLRKATHEVNSGIIPESQLKDRIAEILANPDESLRLMAADAASYQTFTKRLEGAQAITKAVDKFPVIGKFLVPFRNTPANIMKYTFERTPLAPLMKTFREDIAAGGARADLALARYSTGSAILLAAADIAMDGNVTGKGPEDFKQRQALQREGWQQYSIKVGDRYFAYNRMDPIGAMIGLSADMVDILKDVEGTKNDPAIEEMILAGAMAVGNNVMNKTYMSGVSDFIEAMASPERRMTAWAQRAAGSIIPASVAEVARQEDPYMRTATTIVDGIRRRTPGLSKDLPHRRDLWGRKISYKSGIGSWYDVFSPIYSKEEKKNPIDTELNRLEKYINMPQKRTNFEGVSIDMDKYPKAYERYVQLAGNELELPQFEGLGCMDFLSDLVSGKSAFSPVYSILSDGPDGGKAEYIQNIINTYRSYARISVVEEFPDLATEVERKKLEKPSRLEGF